MRGAQFGLTLKSVEGAGVNPATEVAALWAHFLWANENAG